MKNSAFAFLFQQLTPSSATLAKEQKTANHTLSRYAKRKKQRLCVQVTIPHKWPAVNITMK